MATPDKPLISLRSLSRRAPELTEAVFVTHGFRVIGTYTPAVQAPRAAQDGDDRGGMAADPADQPGSEPAGLPGRPGAPAPPGRAPLTRAAQQQERDAVLRRVARGGKKP